MEILTVNGADHSKYAKQIRELYELCFDDTKEYVDYFINRKIAADSSLLMFDGDNLVSMLFFSMKKLRIFSDIYPVPFLYACATHPDVRGKHHMTTLLLVFCASIRRTKLPFIMLHPFDHEYYKRVGFETADFRYEHTVGTGGGLITETDETTVGNLVSLLSEATKHLDISSVRDGRDWSDKLSELLSDGGKAFLALDSGGAKGYFLVANGKTEEAVTLSEISCGSGEGLAGVRYLSLLPSVHMLPNNQVRICDAEAALKIFAPYIPSDFTLSLIDPQISGNSGMYRISAGKCEKLQDAEADAAGNADIVLDIRNLTKALFGAHRFDADCPAAITGFFPFRSCCLLDDF